MSEEKKILYEPEYTEEIETLCEVICNAGEIIDIYKMVVTDGFGYNNTNPSVSVMGIPLSYYSEKARVLFDDIVKYINANHPEISMERVWDMNDNLIELLDQDWDEDSGDTIELPNLSFYEFIESSDILPIDKFFTLAYVGFCHYITVLAMDKFKVSKNEFISIYIGRFSPKVQYSSYLDLANKTDFDAREVIYMERFDISQVIISIALFKCDVWKDNLEWQYCFKMFDLIQRLNALNRSLVVRDNFGDMIMRVHLSDTSELTNLIERSFKIVDQCVYAAFGDEYAISKVIDTMSIPLNELGNVYKFMELLSLSIAVHVYRVNEPEERDMINDFLDYGMFDWLIKDNLAFISFMALSLTSLSYGTFKLKNSLVIEELRSIKWNYRDSDVITGMNCIWNEIRRVIVCGMYKGINATWMSSTTYGESVFKINEAFGLVEQLTSSMIRSVREKDSRVPKTNPGALVFPVAENLLNILQLFCADICSAAKSRRIENLGLCDNNMGNLMFYEMLNPLYSIQKTNISELLQIYDFTELVADLNVNIYPIISNLLGMHEPDKFSYSRESKRYPTSIVWLLCCDFKPTFVKTIVWLSKLTIMEALRIVEFWDSQKYQSGIISEIVETKKPRKYLLEISKA